jgi:hypothetical protein
MARRIRIWLVAVVLGIGLAAAPGVPAAASPVVIGAPGAPTITHLTALGAVVSWTPSSSPQVAIYILETLVGGQWTAVGLSGISEPVPPTAMSVTLTPSTTYTYAVVAEDENGHMSARGPSTTFTSLPRDTALICSAHFNPIVFGTNFLGQVSIRNTGTFILTGGWTLMFAFPGNQQITPNTAFGVNLTQSGHNVTVTSTAGNATIDAFGRVGIQFQGTFSGTFVVPTAYTMNGIPCTVV